MNHLFLFQVHKDYKLVMRILRRIEAPNHYFAINIDGKSYERRELLTVVQDIPNVILITKYRIAHGGYTFTDCTIRQMADCYKNKIHFDYYHTCSGQDYPCVSNAVFDAFFDGSRSYTMMDSPEQVEKWRKGKYKYRLERMNFADQFQGKCSTRIHLNGIVRRIVSPICRRNIDISVIWGGWNWFSLSDKCIKYLLSYFAKFPNYLRQFRYSSAADELVFSTILYYQREKLNIETKNSLRYIDWHPKSDYIGKLPKILDERDYDSILHSGAFFCRKVESQRSSILLDMLDNRMDVMLDNITIEQNPVCISL